jgi:hypothetical protein
MIDQPGIQVLEREAGIADENARLLREWQLKIHWRLVCRDPWIPEIREFLKFEHERKLEIARAFLARLHIDRFKAQHRGGSYVR